MEADHRKSGARRLISGGAWFLVLMILSGIFWLLLGIQISRVYGPSGFGLFNMAYSVYDFMWALIFGGLFEGLIHFGTCHLTENNTDIARYFSNFVRYLTAMSLLIFVALMFLAFQVSDPVFQIILMSLAFAFLFSGTKDALSSILGSQHKSKQLSMIQSGGFYAVSIIGTAFVVLHLPMELLPVLTVFAPIFQLALCIHFLRPYIKDILLFNVEYFTKRKLKDSLIEDIKQFKHILIFGFSISIGKISFMVMKNLDIPILNLFFDYANVGVYSVADTVSSVLFSMTAFSLPIISSMSEAWSMKDKSLIERYVDIAVKYPMMIGLPLTVVVFFLAEPIVVGIYGAAFQGAVVPLQILIIGTFLLMFGRTLSSVLIGIGKAKLAATLLAASAIQYLISLFVLIPLFGLNGAAVSLTLTGFTSLVLIPMFIKRNLNVKMFPGLPKLLVSTATLAAILFVVPKSSFPWVIPGTIAGVVIYVLLLYFTGYLTKEDIKILRAPREQT